MFGRHFVSHTPTQCFHLTRGVTVSIHLLSKHYVLWTFLQTLVHYLYKLQYFITISSFYYIFHPICIFVNTFWGYCPNTLVCLWTFIVKNVFCLVQTFYCNDSSIVNQTVSQKTNQKCQLIIPGHVTLQLYNHINILATIAGPLDQCATNIGTQSWWSCPHQVILCCHR